MISGKREGGDNRKGLAKNNTRLADWLGLDGYRAITTSLAPSARLAKQVNAKSINAREGAMRGPLQDSVWDTGANTSANLQIGFFCSCSLGLDAYSFFFASHTKRDGKM